MKNIWIEQNEKAKTKKIRQLRARLQRATFVVRCALAKVFLMQLK
jgi:hypothetical protein